MSHSISGIVRNSPDPEGGGEGAADQNERKAAHQSRTER